MILDPSSLSCLPGKAGESLGKSGTELNPLRLKHEENGPLKIASPEEHLFPCHNDRFRL